MKTAISIDGLTVAYQQNVVLSEITATIPEGMITGIIGPNGSGKTTLIKTIMGLIPSQTGSINIWGQPLDKVRSSVAYMPQRESVDWNFPASVYDVVAMGRLDVKQWWKRLSKADHEWIMHALEQVQLTDFKDRQIGQLSGGQQQRVFLARALAQQASLLLMDEPFVGVDMVSQQAILDVLGKLRSAGKTLIIVHHDLSTVYESFDYALLLNQRLVASGTVAEVVRPEILSEAYGKGTIIQLGG